MIKEIAIYILVAYASIWLIIFIALSYLRFKEEKIYSKKEKEEGKLQQQGGIAWPIIERKINATREKYKPILDKIERQRKFLQSILPFLKI